MTSTKRNELANVDTPTTRVERLPDIIASDFQDAVRWAKRNPIKASAVGVVAILALRNKSVRGLLGNVVLAFISTKVLNSVEHTLH